MAPLFSMNRTSGAERRRAVHKNAIALASLGVGWQNFAEVELSPILVMAMRGLKIQIFRECIDHQCIRLSTTDSGYQCAVEDLLQLHCNSTGQEF
uniref:Uncharacterized protein n=1 Tax=Romanomermis culicivorax TaxID=13658 RepID=A0A915L9Y2_ROMCU